MALSWIARALAGLALLAWLLEDFAIAAAGGPGESGLEDPLFMVGLVAYLLGAALVALVFTGTRPGQERLIAAVVAIAAAVAAAVLLGPVLGDLLPEGWFADRVGYLVAALGLLLLTMSTHAVRRRRRVRAQAEARQAEEARRQVEEARRQAEESAAEEGEEPPAS